MKGMKNMKRKYLVLIAVLCVALNLLTGCTFNNAMHYDNDSSQTTPCVPETPNQQLSIGNADEVGGYEIHTDSMKCIVMTDMEYKYSFFESYTGNHKIEFYAGPTEMIIIDTVNDVSRYYRETYEDVDQIYTNPLKRVYEDLQKLEFVYLETKDDHNIYEAETTVQVENQEQIKYNVYTVQMSWLDGNAYVFKYYEYADGEVLISAEAPDEINPYLNKNTEWVVNLDDLCVSNESTQQKISIDILNVETGKAVSPNSDATTVTEHKYVVQAYLNTTSNEIDSLCYITDSMATNVTLLTNPTITKPIVSDDMEQINVDELSGILMLVYMLESII
jgi:hypothetical protein